MEAKELLDEIFQAMKVPENALLSDTLKAYENALNIVKKQLNDMYNKGYLDCEKNNRKQHIQKQKDQN